MGGRVVRPEDLKPPALTEEEWLSGQNLSRLIEFARYPFGERDRKMLLSQVGWVRSGWDVLSEDGRRAVEAYEANAEGLITIEERHKHYTAWDEGLCAFIRYMHPEPPDDTPGKAALRAGQKLSLYEVLGNPFRPVAVDPSWLTSTVLALANQMYESRDFSPMPILADALQDAGCGNVDVLTHCRQPGVHFRGCWVVDLLTGRK